MDDKYIAKFRASFSSDNPTDCWLWAGKKLYNGYGYLVVKGRTILAHRFSYELAHGSIDPSLQIDHLCRVRLCVNPAHLEQVTARENVARSLGFTVRKANQTHCKHGHEFTLENTYRFPKTDYRDCRKCRASREVARRVRNRKAV